MAKKIVTDVDVSSNGGRSPSATNGAALDPFDPARLRLTQDFGATVGVRKALLNVPVRKPDRSSFVQVHPDEDYRIQTCVIELREDRETYLVDPALWPELALETMVQARALFTSITRQGVVFLWPVRLPSTDGRIDAWSQSALEAATMATGQWCRVVANMHLGAYEVSVATGDLPKPEWPGVSFAKLLRIAFNRDRYVDTMDHPVLRKLRGES